ncbi:MAG: tRNA pseudouridine synthase D [Cycloclasticus sp. symbiont of Bathymodiolus heckerae]|nr:MAG: tRNA pseudouridine synthase D [Cycloclasticus sp. symbiont of Bathymodiolus heckerae]
MNYERHVDELPYAHGGIAAGVGVIKESPDDFIVNETLSFEPSGEGEHVFLYIKKTGLNTDEVAKILAVHADVPRRSVSYAGMKDRTAVTKQWFSVQLPGKKGPDWHLLDNDAFKIEHITRHLKKLKRGAIKFNEFKIILSQLDVDTELVKQRAERIKMQGVPNYFMEQRFGYKCQNLSRAEELFASGKKIKNRKLRGLFLSSVRSFLFNKVLAQRVKQETWNKAETGDAFMLDGTRQFFHEDVVSSDCVERLDEHDIHPSGPLFGSGEESVSKDAYEIEQAVFTNNPIFCEALMKYKVEFSRRALRVVPHDFMLQWLTNDKIELTFKLQSGSYATAVVRELLRATTSRLG